MSNEYLFILCALADILFVFFSARRGLEWLLGTVATNLILIGIFGSKLVEIFGFTTNAGNIFYACVFLATHFILERYGKHAAFKTISVGVSFALFFIIMAQFAVHFAGVSDSKLTNDCIQTLFSFSVRVSFASIVAYVFSQYVNISLFEWLKIKTHGKFLWLRMNGANIVGQLVDSLLFFSIAFFDLPGPILIQAILAGWLVKTVVVLLGTPFVYLDRLFKK